MKYASVIVDMINTKLDRVFTYKIPEHLKEVLLIGMEVKVPFGKGNRTINGYIIDFTDKTDIDEDKIKDIISPVDNRNVIEGRLVALSAWISKNYGSTMIQALKTVLPAKEKTNRRSGKYVELDVSPETAQIALNDFLSRNQKARARLLAELMEHGRIPYELLSGKLHVSKDVLNALAERSLVKITETTVVDSAFEGMKVPAGKEVELTPDQSSAVDRICSDMDKDKKNTYLIHGITGSGKTEVYIRAVKKAVKNGGSAIILIPEIALTYQTVMRFYAVFGNRVSIMNSRLSKGERYDQFKRALNGEIDVMIGPRSALFAPLPNLKLIVIDEEHETSYKSETTPRYHAVPTAIQRAKIEGASVILGSATPSMESYHAAINGEYVLLELKRRAKENELADVDVIDMREELKNGNTGMISRALDEAVSDRLSKKQQVMLFLNRRGYAGFVSCRECGKVIKCDHCDVSMSLHKENGRNELVCHYCGQVKKVPDICPECGSKHIGVFKAGTQAVEKQLHLLYPSARILRMDMDTTRDKDGHAKILSAFANHEADILIGTQMIVKGHDFPGVTLVGILCADMSLHTGDFRSGERTFELLTQAAGRSGRGNEKGQVIIQTYEPDNYVVGFAAKQDYKSFYDTEISYRELLGYPPAGHIMTVIISGEDAEHLNTACTYLKKFGEKYCASNMISSIGPAPYKVGRIKDRFIKVLYYKHENYDILIRLREYLEAYIRINSGFDRLYIQFDYE